MSIVELCRTYDTLICSILNDSLSLEQAQERIKASVGVMKPMEVSAFEFALRAKIQDITKNQRDNNQTSSMSDDDTTSSKDMGIIFQQNKDIFCLLLDLSIWCGEEAFVEPSFPIDLFGDIFQYETIGGCVVLFSFFRSRIKKFTPSKKSNLSLLKICNSLLRRLSKSNNSLFCGEILLLLASAFSLDERSGVNLSGDFHTDNVTVYNIDNNNIDNVEEKEQVVDIRFYNTLWRLQSYFSNPKQFIEPNGMSKWKTFSELFTTVLSAFESNKLEITEESSLSLVRQSKPFPKYLTNARLLNLQVNDATFRRNILLQSLITLNYIKYCMTNISNDDMESFITRIKRLLQQTGTNGDIFEDSTDRTLQREVFWMKWKESKCFSLKQQVSDFSECLELPVDESPEAKRLLKQILKKKEEQQMLIMMGMGIETQDSEINKLQEMGCNELNQLWREATNDNITEERVNSITLDGFLSEMIDQEKKKKKKKNKKNKNKNDMNDDDDDDDNDDGVITDTKYTWRALRMMRQDNFMMFNECSKPNNLEEIANILRIGSNDDTTTAVSQQNEMNDDE